MFTNNKDNQVREYMHVSLGFMVYNYHAPFSSGSALRVRSLLNINPKLPSLVPSHALFPKVVRANEIARSVIIM